MRYSTIREMDVSNGKGVGVALFVQGCHFHCRGCFNPETWDFNGGKEWNNEIQSKFIELADRPYIKRISILGGEPLADENISDVLNLINQIRENFNDKQIWLYTGYVWEDIVNINPKTATNTQLSRLSAITTVDYVVDGRFDITKQDLYNKKIIFAGSTNQRIIDVKMTLKENNIVIRDGHNQKNKFRRKTK